MGSGLEGERRPLYFLSTVDSLSSLNCRCRFCKPVPSDVLVACETESKKSGYMMYSRPWNRVETTRADGDFRVNVGGFTRGEACGCR